MPAQSLLSIPVPYPVRVPAWATVSSRLPLGPRCKLATARQARGSITGTAIHNAGSITVNRPDASTLSAPIDGAGTLAVQGGGTLTVNVAANTNTYSGNTTVGGGATLQAGAANVMSANSVINIDNTAGSRFNPNGFNQVLAGLSGGGSSSGDVTMGGNNLTFAGIGTNNLNYAGPISSVAGTITMGTTKTQADEALPTGTNRTVAASSKDAVQTLSGAAMNLHRTDNGPRRHAESTPRRHPRQLALRAGIGRHHRSNHSAVRRRNVKPAKPGASADRPSDASYVDHECKHDAACQ